MEGEHCAVWFGPAAKGAFDASDTKTRARARYIIERLAISGPRNLQNHQLKMEGRYPSGRKGMAPITVCAIRAYNLRIYGGSPPSKRPDFYCPEAVKKQRNKARREQLERVAKKLGDLDDVCE